MLRLIRTVCALAALMAAVFTLPAMAASGPDPLGDWHGTLKSPAGALTIIVTISKGDDGALKADLESPDQAPGRKIPMTSISAADGHMAFEIAALHASFKGDWVAAKEEWAGTFSQGIDMPLTLARGLPGAKPVVEGLDGTWNGAIERNGAKLRLVLRITTGKQGTSVTLDSPDQNAFGLPVQELTRDGQKVRLHMALGDQTYEGQLSKDGQTMTGTWSSAVLKNVPVTFTRTSTSSARAALERPQTPKPPFPYTVEEVAFDNPVEPQVHLGGSLTLPKGKGPFAAAVLITGSGAQDRDETIMGHKPFAVIADHLTRHGIAVLRYDDRGVGKSTGDYNAATSADLATDANAAVHYLMTRNDIRHDAIGFIGHSEGGMIGPIAMVSNKDIAFLVMLAGPGTKLDKLLLSQRRLIGASQGMSEAELDRAEPVLKAMFQAIRTADTPQAASEAAKAVLTPEAMAALGVPAGTDKGLIVNRLSGPWFQYFLRYDPAENLRKIRVPVLAMGGSLDRQVPADENLPAIKAALKDDKDVTIEKIPGLNHLFQTAKTGAVGEYRDIKQTFAPVALDIMTDWISKRFVQG